MSVDVVHRPEKSRFEAEGGKAYLTYEKTADGIALTHTIVPEELGGRGVGSALAEAAVAWVREQGVELEPRCPYVRSWLEKHG